MENKILFIDSTDFVSFPKGGSLSFNKNILKVFSSNEIILVGLVKDNEVVGKWFERNINGTVYKYLGLCKESNFDKVKIPKRLFITFQLLKYSKKIFKKSLKRVVFTQSPHFVFVLSLLKLEYFCFYFAGLGNSISLSTKYRSLRFLGTIYEIFLYRLLKKNANVILAAADNTSIKQKEIQYNLNKKILKFPTRYDSEVFYPKDKNTVRESLGISKETIIIITTGRLSKIKGWKLLIDSYSLFIDHFPDSFFYFIGDGQEKGNIVKYIDILGLKGRVILKGNVSPNMVAEYLNLADLFVMGSFIEGWPTSMVEALACGKPIVSTNFSSAYDMISQGKNGFIVERRDPLIFAKSCMLAIKLPNVKEISYNKSKRYSLSTLKSDILKICKI